MNKLLVILFCLLSTNSWAEINYLCKKAEGKQIEIQSGEVKTNNFGTENFLLVKEESEIYTKPDINGEWMKVSEKYPYRLRVDSPFEWIATSILPSTIINFDKRDNTITFSLTSGGSVMYVLANCRQI